MIGQTLEERRAIPVGAILSVALAAICVLVAYLNKEIDWLVFAGLPAILGSMLLLGREPRFRVEFRPIDFVVLNAAETVRYEQIDRIAFVGVGSQPDNGYINVFHEHGVVQIPGRLSASTSEVFQFLTSQVPGQVPPADGSAIHSYIDAQVGTFGADRVWVHCSRVPYSGKRGRAAVFACVGFLVAAVGWCIAAATLQNTSWYIAAVVLVICLPIVWMIGDSSSRKSDNLGRPSAWMLLLLFLGPIGWLILIAHRMQAGRSRRSDPPSYLAICPAGLALEQKGLNGQMRWRELRRLKFRKGFLFSRPTIFLNADGVAIPIHDIYDAPIVDIHRQIEHYLNSG